TWHHRLLHKNRNVMRQKNRQSVKKGHHVTTRNRATRTRSTKNRASRFSLKLLHLSNIKCMKKWIRCLVKNNAMKHVKTSVILAVNITTSQRSKMTFRTMNNSHNGQCRAVTAATSYVRNAQIATASQVF